MARVCFSFAAKRKKAEEERLCERGTLNVLEEEEEEEEFRLM